MRPFAFTAATSIVQAITAGRETAQGQTDARTQFLAGGTTVLDLMKLDVLRPQTLVSLDALRGSLGRVELTEEGLHLGALASMAAVADHADVQREFPVIAQSLQLAASAQLRNMATLGGNVLQKTRCPYYRDPSWSACNKRSPGSGCTALTAGTRNHAVLGTDASCIAQYPGDFAIALIALDAQVEVRGPTGSRRIPFSTLHVPANGQPHIETVLAPGELIQAFFVPGGPWARRSLYLKIRDRASYEFALASAAVALDLAGEQVRQVRIGLGGMAYRPWRALAAEDALMGQSLDETSAAAAAEVALREATPRGANGFKPELARRTLVRALLAAKTLA